MEPQAPEAGYAGLTWPKEYGGAGAPYSFQAIFYEEIAAAQAPPHIGVIGLGMAGPTIIAHGTEEQKARYLEPILSADEIWCQGFSEPDAGSDLAAARTRAERARRRLRRQRPEGVVVLRAHRRLLHPRRAERPRAPRYGLTYLLVDMHAPGVEVRPLRQMTGEAEFNEIFFTDVEVPVENLLGDVGDGWQVAMTTLLHERGRSASRSRRARRALGRLLDVARERARRRRTCASRSPASGSSSRRSASRTTARSPRYERTGIPGPEGSGVKLRWSESNQRLTKLARDLRGPEGILDDGWWRHQQLRSRGNTIEAGTSEVLRNIIAERVLGLPRSR